jgi:ligand-binding sensor domain-containing protein
MSLLAGLAAVIQVAGSHHDAAAQHAGWTSHTAMREVTDIAVSNGVIWTATRGGLFSYETDTGVIQRYTTVEGLSGIHPGALAVDPARNSVWLGYGNGIIDRLNIETGAVRTFHDIARATQFASRSINNLQVVSDTLLVATSFGLVVFDVEKAEVRDSYNRFGGMAPGTAVRDVLVADVPAGGRGFWLATDDGVAVVRAASHKFPPMDNHKEFAGSF